MVDPSLDEVINDLARYGGGQRVVCMRRGTTLRF
jgi:hypothetical protein